MKGIATCEDCQFYITIYRFTGNQGLLSIPKKWCEECDFLVRTVKKTINDLGIESKTQLTIKPWFLWWWQSLLKYMAWHAPILIINGKLISQGEVPNKEVLVQALNKNVVQTTELGKM